jgi:hypothetical protein
VSSEALSSQRAFAIFGEALTQGRRGGVIGFVVAGQSSNKRVQTDACAGKLHGVPWPAGAADAQRR